MSYFHVLFKSIFKIEVPIYLMFLFVTLIVLSLEEWSNLYFIFGLYLILLLFISTVDYLELLKTDYNHRLKKFHHQLKEEFKRSAKENEK